MKKEKRNMLPLSMLLIAMGGLTILSGCSKKANNQNLTYDELVEANTCSALLKNHTSVKVTMSIGSDREQKYELYVDSDSLAQDYGDYQVVYTSKIQGSLEGDVFTPVLNLSDENFYENSREYFLMERTEGETITDTIKDDDSFMVNTTITEDVSKPIIISLLGEAEDGDYLSVQYKVKASDYSILSYELYLSHEGKEQQLISCLESIEYDVERPTYIMEAEKIAAVPLEGNNTESLRTVSVIMDPDTEKEKTVSVTMPRGTGVTIIRKDGYSTLYKDKSCTEMYIEGTADRNEDLTLYTIPDSGTDNTEQTSEKELTMDEAVKANTVENLLKQYKSITYAQLDYVKGNTTHNSFFQNEQGEVCFVEEDNGYVGYGNDALCVARENGKSDYILHGEAKGYVSEYLFMVPDSEFTSQEIEAQGNIACETMADISEEYAEELSAIWSVTTEDKMINRVVFAADNYRVMSSDFIILHPDKSEQKIASGVVICDDEILYPEDIQNYLNSEMVTITITLSDGNIRTAEIPKGECFSWSCDEGYALYADSDGITELPELSASVEADQTVYVLKAK